MSNAHTVYVDPNMTAADYDRLRNQLEYENRRNGGGHHPAPVRVGLPHGRTQVDFKGDGTMTVSELYKGTSYAQPGLRPGHVIINGMETTIEAAKNAGFKIDTGEGEQRRPFDKGSSSQEGVHRADVQDRGTEQRPDLKPAPARQDAASERDGDGEAESPEAIASRASETIQTIERTHGIHVVDEGLGQVAESGYVPDEADLPPGVTSNDVQSIVAGYVAAADSTLSAVGSSVNMLMETLTEDELRSARMATLVNDTAKMHHLGKSAVDRLALLPSRDPEGFAEMVEGMSAAERKAISQNAHGDWIVTVPGKPPMSFGLAVRQGIVRV